MTWARSATTHSAEAVPPALAAGSVPYWLTGYEKLYRRNPRQAAIQWFQDAKFGLFIHYGLYSLEGVHAFDQWKNTIPVAAYETHSWPALTPRYLAPR